MRYRARDARRCDRARLLGGCGGMEAKTSLAAKSRRHRAQTAIGFAPPRSFRDIDWWLDADIWSKVASATTDNGARRANSASPPPQVRPHFISGLMPPSSTLATQEPCSSADVSHGLE